MFRSVSRLSVVVLLAFASAFAPHHLPGSDLGVQVLGRDSIPRWSPPLERSLEVSGPFRAPPHAYGSGHRGIDIPASPGETVLAPASGIVSFAGPVVDRVVVSIRVDARTVVSLEPVTAMVSEGARVVQGQAIGQVSTGGHCAAECVHLGVRVDTAPGDSSYINPLRFYLDKPVLLPW